MVSHEPCARRIVLPKAPPPPSPWLDARARFLLRSIGRGKQVYQDLKGGLDFGSGIQVFNQVDPLAQGVAGGKIMTEKSRDKFLVLVPSGHELAHGQIVDFKAPSHRAVGVGAGELDETILPAGGKNGGGGADPVRIVVKRRMKRRQFAQGAVDQLAFFRVGLRVQVEFHRHAKLSRGIGILSQNGLTADADEFFFLRHLGGGPQNVLNFGKLHISGKPPCAPAP